MASSAPHIDGGQDSDSDLEPMSAFLLFDNGRHSTVWDPKADEFCIISGKIFCEMIFPNQRLISLSLGLDYHVPPGATGESQILPILQATLDGSSDSITAYANITNGRTWRMDLQCLLLEDLLQQHLYPEHSNRRIVRFKVYIPVGSKFFKDMGSGTVTRSFNLRYKAKSRYGRVEKEDWGEEVFSVTTMKAQKVMRPC